MSDSTSGSDREPVASVAVDRIRREAVDDALLYCDRMRGLATRLGAAGRHRDARLVAGAVDELEDWVLLSLRLDQVLRMVDAWGRARGRLAADRRLEGPSR